MIVRVWAGDEHGYGECYPSGPVAAIDRVVHSLAEQLVGADARNVDVLAEKMRRRHLFTGAQGGAVTTAISGLEIALWDLAGRLQGVSVSRLLGGAFRSMVPLYADCHAGTIDAAGHHIASDRDGHNDLESAVTAAREAVERGFRAVKIDVDDVFGEDAADEWNRSLNRRQIDRMAQQVQAVRSVIGKDIGLAVDMHGRYDVASAIRAARALEEFDLLWLEEPVPPENLAPLAEIRRRVKVPIASGENLYTRFAMRELLRVGAVDTITPDLAKAGGLADGKRIAALAELDYVGFSPHNVCGPIGTMAAAHVCAACSNSTWLEFHALDLPYWNELVHDRDRQFFRDGRVEVPDRPGLGIELDEAAAARYVHQKSGVTFFRDGLLEALQ